MTDRAPLKPATVAAQLGGFVDGASAGVVPPIQPSTTFVRGPDNELLKPGNVYGRDDSDGVRLAEALLAELEGAAAALLFPSGMAAIAAVYRTLPAGASVVVQSGIYWGATKFVREFCARRGVKLTEVDAADAGAFAAACAAERPALAHVETPSNPWLKTTDVAAAAEAVHAVGGLLMVDATAATPILTKPLSLGADIVMHSATKAINGHSDVLAGALATNAPEAPIWTAIREDRHDAGAILGAFEAWLLARGMRTLPLRMERMSANAMAVAAFLQGHERVETVRYPGLPSDPGHAVARRQMEGGFGCLLSFDVRGGAEEALAVAGRLKLFHRATSLGGVESLVEHRHTIEPAIPPNLLRLSAGIEDEGDLIADLAQALEG
ncbi:MAG: PLP-dependent transferase [Pseudomonadota bacterium]